MVSDQEAWLRILDDLNARLPKEDIWITELAATSGGKLSGNRRDWSRRRSQPHADLATCPAGERKESPDDRRRVR